MSGAPASDPEYHGTSSVYLLPSNEVERERLNKQQQLLSAIFDNQVIIPPVNLAGSEVLDIGTGSGAWPLDVLEKHPDAHKAMFTCVDIASNIFPSNPPSNMKFTTMSVLNLPEDWTSKYTLVHQRLLLSGIKYDEWALTINEIYRIVAPGGWAQLCELDPYISSEGPCNQKLNRLTTELSKQRGLDYDCAQRIPSLLKAAGFADVKTDKRTLKFGGWGGQMGKALAGIQITVMRGMKGPILGAGGFGLANNEEELDKFLDELEAEWEAATEAEISWFMFVGQKVL